MFIAILGVLLITLVVLASVYALARVTLGN
jgi:hypothetical protein